MKKEIISEPITNANLTQIAYDDSNIVDKTKKRRRSELEFQILHHVQSAKK